MLFSCACEPCYFVLISYWLCKIVYVLLSAVVISCFYMFWLRLSPNQQTTTSIYWYVDNSGAEDPFVSWITDVAATPDPPRSNSISWGCNEYVSKSRHFFVLHMDCCQHSASAAYYYQLVSCAECICKLLFPLLLSLYSIPPPQLWLPLTLRPWNLLLWA